MEWVGVTEAGVRWARFGASWERRALSDREFTLESKSALRGFGAPTGPASGVTAEPESAPKTCFSRLLAPDSRCSPARGRAPGARTRIPS